MAVSAGTTSFHQGSGPSGLGPFRPFGACGGAESALSGRISPLDQPSLETMSFQVEGPDRGIG